MKWLDWLEKRFGAYAVPEVTLWLLLGQAMVFAAQYVGPLANGGFGNLVHAKLSLDPQAIYDGEWWRLLTFPFLAPLNDYALLVIFYFYLFYLIGTTLDGVWGTFRFNVFLAIGYLATVGAAFLADAIQPGAGSFTYEYVYGSMFLAFARLYPDFTIMLMFILPVKIKWLAWLQWFGYWVAIILGDWHTRLMVLAAVFNYLVFFGRDLFVDAKQGHRRMKHKAKHIKHHTKVVHECRVCGLTSEMAPRTSFRYCSKCAGQCCYCPDHIHNHECVVEADDD